MLQMSFLTRRASKVLIPGAEISEGRPLLMLLEINLETIYKVNDILNVNLLLTL